MARRPRRTFTAEFKAKVVLDLLAGPTTPAEVCRKHQLSPSLVALWKAALLERLPTVFQADDRHSADADRIAGLERLVGQQAVRDVPAVGHVHSPARNRPYPLALNLTASEGSCRKLGGEWGRELRGADSMGVIFLAHSDARID